MYSLPEGSGLLLLVVLAGLQVNVISERFVAELHRTVSGAVAAFVQSCGAPARWEPSSGHFTLRTIWKQKPGGGTQQKTLNSRLNRRSILSSYLRACLRDAARVV